MSGRVIDITTRNVIDDGSASVPTFYPAGMMAEGKLSLDATGVVVITLVDPQLDEDGQSVPDAPPIPLASVVITAELAYQFGQLLTSAGARTQVAASDFQRKHARRLSNERKQASKLVLPPGFGDKPDA